MATKPVYISPEMQVLIFDRILSGNSMNDICVELKIPRMLVSKYAAVDPEFHKQLEIVRAEALDARVESLFQITDGCETMTDVQSARLESENIRWGAERMFPRKYGQRLDIAVQHTVDLSRVLAAANARIVPLLEAKQAVIAASPTVAADAYIEEAVVVCEAAEGELVATTAAVFDDLL